VPGWENPGIHWDSTVSPSQTGISPYILHWLVVLTILKNISQWEGLSLALWKIKVFETTNQCSNGWPFPIFNAHKALQRGLPQLLPRAFGMMNQETIHGLHTTFLAGFLPQSQATHGSCDRSGLR
jgi:hypothetical protein